MRTARKLSLGLAAILLLLCWSNASAQETTATLTGQVTDQSGAAVSGADVTLTNTATGETRSVKSNDEGYYSLTFVPPGTYNLSVKLQGFKEYVSTGLELFVNDRKTLNIGLETGQVTEAVTVTAEATTLQTTPTVGDVVEQRRVVELPLNDRNFQQLVRLVPGVSAASGSPGIGLTNTTNISINGTRRNAINWLVDGVSNTDVGSSVTLLSVPTIDSIQEFRVITSVPTAEFGRAAGGVVNLITRGGTPDIHGGVYEFLRNDKLNANSFFNNTAGRFTTDTAARPPDQIVPGGDPRAGEPRIRRPLLRYNNFGWNLGGPVWIPKLYEQRDKTLFFFSQEWRRIIRAPGESIITVPSLLERQGDFSEPGNLTIFDPLTSLPFPGNRIPANRLDPTAIALLNLVPEPTVASLTAGRAPNRFAVTAPNFQNTRQETVRIDHIFNSNHRLMGRYTHDLSQTRELGGLFFGATIPNVATTDTNVPGQILAVTLTSTFGSNIVNEISFNFSGNAITTDLVGQFTRDNVSIPNTELFPENNSELPPTISAGTVFLGAGQLFNINYKNFNPKQNITLLRGAHTIKAGADISWERKNENAANNSQGTFTFSGLQTRVGSGGIAFADFLLGRASTYSEAERDITNHLRFGRTEFYVQDTWKVGPRFQLDFGIRYQLFRQPKDAENVLTAFFPELYDPARAPQFANATGSLFVAGSGDPLNGIAVAGENSPFGRRVQKTDKNDWAPRVGFAWSPWSDERTVIRGGYGIYYDQALVGIVEQNAFTLPPFNNSVSLSGTASTPIFYNNPTAGNPPATIGNRGAVTTTSDPFDTPRVQQWNLTIQRELNNKTAFEIGYAGSAGDNLIRPVDINAPTPEEILAVAATIPACNTPTTANNCINRARPFRGYGAITDRQTTASSRYHALLSSFRLRQWRGLTTQLAYTWSKNLTDATNDRDAIDVPQIRTNFDLERAVARLDRTHVFVASYVYELPYPTNGFMSNAFLKQVLGGWQVAGITTAQSGLTVPRVIIGDVAPGLVPRGNRANILGDPLASVPVNPAGGNPYFFNPLAFRPAGVGEIGDSPRSPLRFPRQVYTDIEFAKNWRWGESYRVQLRAEFFNVFNQTIFDNANVTLPANRLPSDPIFNSFDAFRAVSSFGQFTSALAPREIQIGLKFNF